MPETKIVRSDFNLRHIMADEEIINEIIGAIMERWDEMGRSKDGISNEICSHIIYDDYYSLLFGSIILSFDSAHWSINRLLRAMAEANKICRITNG